MKLKESRNIELKKCFTHELKKEVVAFLNTCDGKIYIGVNDEGEVEGLEDINRILEKTTASIRNSIKPDISMYVEINLEKIENKEILVIDVQRGASRPYYIAEKGLKPSGVYIRQGNISVPASDEHIKEMIKETDGSSFEKLRALNQSLSFKYAEEVCEKFGLDFGVAQKKTLGLINEENLYTNLALLISDQCNHSIKIAVFEGREKSVFKDRKEFTGSLLKQLNEAFEYINLLNKKVANFEGLVRRDERDYPTEAIREALLNAVVHREYSFGGSTLINIYEDRIEFTSLGGIVLGLSLESIMLGVSQSRNEKLANFFYRLHLIEAYGTGIQKIISSYNNFNIKPIINAEKGVFQVIIYNLHYKKNRINEYLEISENNDFSLNIQPIHKKILDLITIKGGVSRKEIEDYLLVSQTKVINLLREMLELNLISKIKKIDDARTIIYIRK